MANNEKTTKVTGIQSAAPVTLDEALARIQEQEQELQAARAETISLREKLKPIARVKGSSIGPVPATIPEEVFMIPMSDPFFAGAMRTFQKLGGQGEGPAPAQRPIGLLLEANDPLTVPVLQDYLKRCRSVDPKRTKEVEAAIQRFSPKPKK